MTIKKGERCYQFICEGDSPLGEIHDVLHEMKQHIVGTIIDQSKKEDELLTPAPKAEMEIVDG